MQEGRIGELAHPAMLADEQVRKEEESVEPVVILADLGLEEHYAGVDLPLHEQEIRTLCYRDIGPVNEDIVRQEQRRHPAGREGKLSSAQINAPERPPRPTPAAVAR